MENEETLVYRLRKRAEIRRNITTRKSVQEDKPDRIADILEEAANEIEYSQLIIIRLDNTIDSLDRRLAAYDN
jgi:hypothetical protein